MRGCQTAALKPWQGHGHRPWRVTALVHVVAFCGSAHVDKVKPPQKSCQSTGQRSAFHPVPPLGQAKPGSADAQILEAKRLSAGQAGD